MSTDTPKLIPASFDLALILPERTSAKDLAQELRRQAARIERDYGDAASIEEWGGLSAGVVNLATGIAGRWAITAARQSSEGQVQA